MKKVIICRTRQQVPQWGLHEIASPSVWVWHKGEWSLQHSHHTMHPRDLYPFDVGDTPEFWTYDDPRKSGFPNDTGKWTWNMDEDGNLNKT